MPRYYFNLEDGKSYPDEEGTELPSLVEARQHALRYAGHLLPDIGDDFWSGAEWTLTVTDSKGLTLFRLMLVGSDAACLR